MRSRKQHGGCRLLFLVSTKLTITAMMSKWLPYYHQVLLESNTELDFPWDTCVSYFRTCLLNQFIVLVCYDDISKTLLKTQVESSEVLEHYSQHFMNVNKRCIEALLSQEMNILEYSLPPLKTDSDGATTSDGGAEAFSNHDAVIRQL